MKASQDIVEDLLGRRRLQVRADRHVGRQPPRWGAEDDQVVITLPSFWWYTDLTGLPAKLRREHADDLQHREVHRELRKLLAVVGIGELDRRLGHVVAPCGQASAIASTTRWVCWVNE
jgi:hypothetical protein